MLPKRNPAVLCQPVAEGAILLHTEREIYVHAWVELNGHVLGDTAQHTQTFKPATDLRLVQR
jgi:hypothetical protein